MNWTIYRTPKQAILKKLKEIRMDKLEDRKGPAAEADKVASREEKFEGTDVEYSKTIYDNNELSTLERGGSFSHDSLSPTKEQPAVEEIKKA